MTLKRAPRHERKLMLQQLGYASMQAYQIDRETRPGTTMRLVRWLETIRGVRSVRFGPPTPGVIVTLLAMRWWAWLAFGWLHRRAYVRATNIMMREKPAGVDFVIGFEP